MSVVVPQSPGYFHGMREAWITSGTPLPPTDLIARSTSFNPKVRYVDSVWGLTAWRYPTFTAPQTRPRTSRRFTPQFKPEVPQLTPDSIFQEGNCLKHFGKVKGKNGV